MFKIFWIFIVDLFFPKFCCGCNKMETYLCASCFNKIDLTSLPVQLKLEPLYLDQLNSLAYYDGVIKKLIHTFKYDHIQDVGQTLAHLLYYSVQFPKIDFITAVPLSVKRKKERGFNQSEVIAIRLAELLQLPYQQFLIRTTFLKAQAEVENREERLQNIKGQFVYTNEVSKKILQDKKILIIDDVCTTGSTLNECAKILKAHGARAVLGLTLAHGG